MLTAGRKPEKLRIVLTVGNPFSTEFIIDAADQFFLETPTLVFDMKSPAADVVWSSELGLGAKTATWNVSATQVNLLIAGSKGRKARLTYGDIDWATGQFEVVDD